MENQSTRTKFENRTLSSEKRMPKHSCLKKKRNFKFWTPEEEISLMKEAKKRDRKEWNAVASALNKTLFQVYRKFKRMVSEEFSVLDLTKAQIAVKRRDIAIMRQISNGNTDLAQIASATRISEFYVKTRFETYLQHRTALFDQYFSNLKRKKRLQYINTVENLNVSILSTAQFSQSLENKLADFVLNRSIQIEGLTRLLSALNVLGSENDTSSRKIKDSV